MFRGKVLTDRKLFIHIFYAAPLGCSNDCLRQVISDKRFARKTCDDCLRQVAVTILRSAPNQQPLQFLQLPLHFFAGLPVAEYMVPP